MSAPAEQPASQRRAVAFVPALEGLRGYAALLVVVYHCWLLTHIAHVDDGPLRALLATGFFGLNFFFVLSGFVLFLPTVLNEGRFGSVKSYASRRIARIVPAYYFAIAIGLLALPLIVNSTAAAWDGITTASVFAHLTFLQTEVRLIPGYDAALGFGINPVLWTLSVEAAFYIALPIVARRYAAKPLLALAIAVLVSAACRYLLVHDAFDLSRADTAQALSLFPLFCADFAIGMTGAALYVRWRERGRVKRLAPFAAIAALISLTGLMLAAGSAEIDQVRPETRDSLLLSIGIPLAFGVLALAAVLSPARLQWPVSNRAARFAGKISYGTYLFHFLVIGFAINTLGFARDGSNSSFYAMVAFVLPLSLLAGWLSFVGIEGPARRYARRRLARDKSAAAPLPATGDVSPGRSPA